MTNECASDFFCRYQTLIGNGIGFGGVILTLVVNAWLSRKQQERHLTEERNAIRTALTADLAMIRDAISERLGILDRIEKYDENDPLFWTEIKDVSVFNDKLNERVGILEPRQVESVMDAYLAFKKIGEKMTIYRKLYAIESEIYTHSVQHGTKQYDEIQKLHALTKEKIDRAISMIAP